MSLPPKELTSNVPKPKPEVIRTITVGGSGTTPPITYIEFNEIYRGKLTRVFRRNAMLGETLIETTRQWVLQGTYFNRIHSDEVTL